MKFNYNSLIFIKLWNNELLILNGILIWVLFLASLMDLFSVKRHHQWSRKLSEVLVKTRKCMIYHLINRLIWLILTLPVSTATTEHVFSAMKCVKTRLRNRMEDDYLTNFLITYIEKDIARGLYTNSIIDVFNNKKERRT